MIRAHLATFPPRSDLLMQTVQTILPQVDLLCICLNEYSAIPAKLGDLDNVQAVIPDGDLKDAGKFAFPVAPDDMVFTIDDDILYPPDYVAQALAAFDRLDPGKDVVGHLGHALVMKKDIGRKGWRNFKFDRAVKEIFKVDILGTGTACQLGRNLPGLEDMASAAGFVDLRHARLHHLAGRSLWVLPHAEGAIHNNMTEALWESSLFKSVALARHPATRSEYRRLLPTLTPHSGLKLDKVLKERAKPGG